MSNVTTILSTRRLPPELLSPLEAAGFHTIHADFIRKVFQTPEKKSLPGEFVVLTSKTAVQAWVQLAEKWQFVLSEHKVFCLEAATKLEADRHHLPVAGTAPDAEALAELIIRSGKVKTVSFVGSDRRLDILPNKLRNHGITVDEVVAYRTELSPVVVKEPLQGILFFSPSAIDSLLSVHPIPAAVCFCIGGTTAAYARQKGFDPIVVSEKPSPEAMIKAVVQYYKNPIHAQE